MDKIVSVDAWVCWPVGGRDRHRRLRYCEVCSGWELPGATHLCVPGRAKHLADLPPPLPDELKPLP